MNLIYVSDLYSIQIESCWTVTFIKPLYEIFYMFFQVDEEFVVVKRYKLLLSLQVGAPFVHAVDLFSIFLLWMGYQYLSFVGL